MLRAIIFMSDGRGLPRSMTPAFWLIAATYLLAAQLRHAWLGDLTPIGVLFGAVLMIVIVLRFLSSSRFQLVPLYFCVSTGVDLASVMLTLAGIPNPSSIISAWEIAAFGVAATRAERRLKAELEP